MCLTNPSVSTFCALGPRSFVIFFMIFCFHLPKVNLSPMDDNARNKLICYLSQHLPRFHYDKSEWIFFQPLYRVKLWTTQPGPPLNLWIFNFRSQPKWWSCSNLCIVLFLPLPYANTEKEKKKKHTHQRTRNYRSKKLKFEAFRRD
jgi:hypothetical protein